MLGDFQGNSGLYDDIPSHLKRQMFKDLKQKADDVYTINPDGKTYLAPHALRGVPVARIDESADYYESGWTSLEPFLELQAVAEKDKKQYREMAEALGIAKDAATHPLRKKEKDAVDNCSKYTKINEIFGKGGGKYHPNQLVAKAYLPPEGLCDKECLYKIARQISKLQGLKERGKLAMDPYDFYRWTLSKKVAHSLQQRVQGKSRSVRSIILGMGDEGREREGPDDNFRTVVIYWAYLFGKERSFGPKKATKPPSRLQVAKAAKRAATASVAKCHAAEQQAADRTIKEQRLAKRINSAMRRQLAKSAAPSVYCGVNALRQSQAAK